MNYDDWLVWNEHEYRGWNKEYTCRHCEKPMYRDETYCSSGCAEADML